jgi:hypothetical protein
MKPPRLRVCLKSSRLVLLALMAVLVAAGCTTKSKARAEAGAAFAAGQNEGLRLAQTQGKDITIIGPVRNRVVLWEEGLTLAHAIDAAVYTGFSDPRLIVLKRGPESVTIKANDLLRGVNNPVLEPGDLVEIRQ